jgi:hypothetical protein
MSLKTSLAKLPRLRVGPLHLDWLHAGATALVLLYVLDQNAQSAQVIQALGIPPNVVGILGTIGVVLAFIGRSIFGVDVTASTGAAAKPPAVPPVALLALAGALWLTGCTPAAKSAINTAINVTVEACQEIPNFVPPSTAVGAVVGLICQAIEAGAPAVEVIVDSNVWNGLKEEYKKTHNGMLPTKAAAPGAALDLSEIKRTL